MKNKKIYLWIQTGLCLLLCILLAAATVELYQEGVRQQQEEGDPDARIITREKVSERFGAISPLFFASIGFAAAGLVLGLRDENQDAPVKALEDSGNLLHREIAVPSDAMTVEQEKRKTRKRTAVLRVCLLVLAVILIVHGVCNGSMTDVLKKAVKICTECVGLG